MLMEVGERWVKRASLNFFISTDFSFDKLTNIMTKITILTMTIDDWHYIDKYTKGGAHAFAPFWPQRSYPCQCLSCCWGILWSSIQWWGNIMTLIHLIINFSYWSTTSLFFTPLKMVTVWLDDMNTKLNDINHPGASLGSSCWDLVRGWSDFIEGSLAGNRVVIRLIMMLLGVVMMLMMMVKWWPAFTTCKLI